MFRLSRREGSTVWQVRKRWPSEVAPILKGEFTKSTGEADRNKARATLPLIAAEYESKIQLARDRLEDNRYRDLAEPEIARLTAQFYRTALPSYRIKRALSPAEAQAMLVEVQSRVATFESAQARHDYWAVEAISKALIAQEGLPIPEDSPSRDTLKALLMRAFTELHRGIAEQLQGNEEPTPTDVALAKALEIKSDTPARTVNALITVYKEAKWEDWSQSSRDAVEPPLRLLKDTIGDREVASITREDARAVLAVLRESLLIVNVAGDQAAIQYFSIRAKPPLEIEKFG